MQETEAYTFLLWGDRVISAMIGGCKLSYRLTKEGHLMWLLEVMENYRQEITIMSQIPVIKLSEKLEGILSKK